MARLITGTYGAAVYPEVIDNVRRRGARRDSRNGLTYELPDVTIALDSPLNALPLGCGRNLKPAIAAAEALQLIGAFTEPDWLCRISPKFDRYRENVRYWNGDTENTTRLFHGAYGTRVGSQLESVIDKLTRDPHTRQAVVTLWDPDKDNELDHLDYPCTVALGFNITDREVLNMRVIMRSNDVWLGLPYDMFQFTQLQLTLCNVVGLLPGTYTHTAWSLHLYLTNVEESYDVTDTIVPPHKTLPHVQGVGNRLLVDRGQAFVHMRDRARALALQQLPDYTVSEAWYVDTLREFPINLAPDADRDGQGAGEAQPVQS